MEDVRLAVAGFRTQTPAHQVTCTAGSRPRTLFRCSPRGLSYSALMLFSHCSYCTSRRFGPKSKASTQTWRRQQQLSTSTQSFTTSPQEMQQNALYSIIEAFGVFFVELEVRLPGGCPLQVC